ncbi:hypothetical protein [Rhodocyclus purpureus]|uniref:hypothetical protein n=1 Tax=Rhodocyclus purpureus TaxID=1067 RepID=UPI001914B2CA|nr:hypothetical protein [Rhodocyclus purpureus]
MRYVILALLTAAAAPTFADSTAAAGACYSISNPDQRTLCLARAHGNSGLCYSIKAADLRAQCLAEVKK